jgi:methionine-rich copper-binding protein CopC
VHEGVFQVSGDRPWLVAKGESIAVVLAVLFFMILVTQRAVAHNVMASSQRQKRKPPANYRNHLTRQKLLLVLNF